MTRPRKLTVLPLVAATYFMVAGGPYGLEELVASAGYGGAIVALLVTPLVWSLPTALMVGELGAAVPQEGGYYEWVRRAMGPFWGFQEAWLSLAASFFDMALYPTVFALYLGRLWPAAGQGWPAIALGAAMIAGCAVYNLRGAGDVGRFSVVIGVVMLVPFGIVALAAVIHGQGAGVAPAREGGGPGFLAGIGVAMWNYMGWDNASTVAGEVERPERTYPLGMLLCVALVTLTYVLPVAAMWHAGVDPSGWTTGSWVDAARTVGGDGLAFAILAGGVLGSIAMFNALVMSYSRLPLVLAEDRLLPRWFARRSPRTGAPWVAVLACAVAYASCLGLGFDRLVQLDVMVYGVSLLLEFFALVLLRIKEPGLARPFRVPGGLPVACLLGVGPLVLLVLALIGGRSEQGATGATLLGAGLILAGPLLYWISARRGTSPAYRRS